MQRLTRREALAGTTRLGIGLGALSILGGCAPQPAIRLGINGGQQPLFRNVAARRDDVLKPLGYDTVYSIFQTEPGVREAFKANKLDVVATLLPQAAVIHREDVPIQVFASIAWAAETLPMMVYSGADPQTIKDLAGQRIAVLSPTDPGFAYWRALALGNDNLRLDTQATLVDKPSDLLTAMTGNPTVDAVVATNGDLNLLKAVGAFRSIGDLGSEWKRLSPSSKPLIFGVLLARKSWIGDHRKFVDDFIKATADSMDGYKTDKDGFVRRITTTTPTGFQPLAAQDATSTATYLGMDTVGSDRVAITDADIADAGKLFDLLARSGALSGPIDKPAEMFYKRS